MVAKVTKKYETEVEINENEYKLESREADRKKRKSYWYNRRRTNNIDKEMLRKRQDGYINVD